MTTSSLWLNPQMLKRERLRSALTQAELADRASIHTVTLSRIETGMQKASTTTIRRLADALGVKVTAIADIKEVEV
jgi:transcriptional regulator with XRE-family HTH domain